MKTRYLSTLLAMIAITATVLTTSATASTVLVNFEKKISDNTSSDPQTKEKRDADEKDTDGLPINVELAEELLSQYLHQAGFTVVAANEVAPSKWLFAAEIQAGRSGKTSMLRKMAALNDASIFFNGILVGSTTKEKYLGVTMSSTVLTISYRVVKTGSGETVDIHSKEYMSTARADAYAQHSAMDKMAKDVASLVTSRLSAEELEKARTGLPGYKQQFIQPVPKTGMKTKQSKKRITKAVPKDKKPPEIVLIQPPVTRGFAVVMEEPSPTINVAGFVRDESPIMYVSLNGIKTGVDTRGYFSSDVAVNDEIKKIVIESMDKPGNKTRKEFQILPPKNHGERGAFYENSRSLESTSKPVLWGLSIGVSTYGSMMADLSYADEDARSLSDFFTKKNSRLYSEVRFKTLVNDEVTRSSILENISRHLGQAAPEDVVLIFMAGHGVRHAQTGSYYFLPYDVDTSNLLSKGLRMSDFEESVKILSQNVNKLVIAMDTCHAGSLDVNVRSKTEGENLAAVLKESTGVYILSAAKSGEVSVEDKRFKLHDRDPGHGVFTYALIEGMMGKANYNDDGYVSLNELFQFVAKQVPRLTQGRQHPFFRSAGTDLPLVLME